MSSERPIEEETIQYAASHGTLTEPSGRTTAISEPASYGRVAIYRRPLHAFGRLTRKHTTMAIVGALGVGLLLGRIARS